MSAARPSRRHGRQGGFSFVELMVALTVSLFLLGGLLTMVQSTKHAFVSQNSMSQLEDSERLAMVMLGDVVQAGGYFVLNAGNLGQTQALQLQAVPAYGLTQAGQAFAGTQNAAAPEDSVTVQYQTASGDGVINCIGQTNTTGGLVTYVNTFSILPDASGTPTLMCTLVPVVAGVPGAAIQYPLVSGVQNLQVYYGVKTAGGADDQQVDTYLRASELNANPALWLSVVCVRIQLTFNNPLYSAANPAAQPQTISFSRVVNVMNKAGVTT